MSDTIKNINDLLKQTGTTQKHICNKFGIARNHLSWVLKTDMKTLLDIERYLKDRA